VTRRSIILVVCGVLTVLVGIAVALLSSDRSAPASTASVEVDADSGSGSGSETTSGAPVAQAPSASRPDVPEGTEAVAVDASFVAGGAGFAAAGDRVNVFALVDEPVKSTVAVLSDVQVLEVSSGAATSGSSSGGSSSGATPKQVTYVLAVPVDEVEGIVQAAGFNRLYITFPSEGDPPRPTSAVGSADAGDAEAGEVAP